MMEATTAPTPRTMRLLIVDDALIMRKRIRELAEIAGWEIAGEANDGEQAVEIYLRENPDLVTLDIVMPRLDGVSALKQIVGHDPHARVVMVSASSQKNKLEECTQAGAMDFIVKPFDRSAMLHFLQKSLAYGSFSNQAATEPSVGKRAAENEH